MNSLIEFNLKINCPFNISACWKQAGKSRKSCLCSIMEAGQAALAGDTAVDSTNCFLFDYTAKGGGGQEVASLAVTVCVAQKELPQDLRCLFMAYGGEGGAKELALMFQMEALNSKKEDGLGRKTHGWVITYNWRR